MNSASHKLVFMEIVDALCKRPAMYTLNGTFPEVVAFLSGYACGAKVGPNSSSLYFLEFYRWVHLNHQSDAEGMEKLAAEDRHQEALSELARLYRRYERSECSPDR